MLRKSIGKMRKSRILGSQNPPKIVPKCLQNRGSKKHAIFIEFGVDFLSFFDSPTLKFCAHSQCFVRIFYFSLFLIWRRFWSRKTSQKRLRNHPETMKKSMLKACCFSTSIFERSASIWEPPGPPKWSQVGPKWLHFTTR